MPILVKLVGIFFGAVAIGGLINANNVRKLAEFWQRGDKRYAQALIRVIVGFLFIWSAPLCKISAVILILGWLILLSGAAILFFSLEKYKSIFEWFKQQPDKKIRTLTLVPLLLALLILYAA